MLAIAFILLININSPLVVSAATTTPNYNYRDYTERIDSSGDEIVSYFNFPASFYKFTAFSAENENSNLSTEGVDSISFQKKELVSDQNIHIRCLYKPLGTKMLSLDNVPNGSTFGYNLIWSISSSQSFYCNYYASVVIRYYNSAGSLISTQDIKASMQQFGNVATSTGASARTLIFSASADLVKPENARYCKIYCYLDQGLGSSSGKLSQRLVYRILPGSTFSLGISSSYVNEETDRESNKLLGEIVDQNESLINGTPQQNAAVSDANDEMITAGDKLGELTDQMEVEKPDTEDIDVSIDSFIPETSILAYTGPILAFWNNDSLKAMLIIVLTLVLVSWVMFGKKG